MKLQRRTVAVIAIAGALLCLVVCGWVVWRVERALGGAGRDAAQRNRLDVEERTLGAQPNPGFEGIGSPAVFKSAALFQGSIYLAGPAGLYVYAADGRLEHLYRIGMDLPAAPLGEMVVGMPNGARQPELLIATLGEGVLAFDGHGFRQIRASKEEARTVTSILPLASGRLLIGTSKLGLLIYDGKTLKSFHTTTDNVYVTCLAGTEAELWVGTLNDGLLHWHGGQTERLGEEQGLPDRRVEQIALTDGRAYVGTPMGVAEVREGKIARVLAKGRYAHALLVDGDALLVGQVEAGVMRVPLTGPEGDAKARRPIAALDSHPFRKEHGKDGAPRFVDSQVSKARPGAPRTDEKDKTKSVSITVEQFLSVGENRYALATGGLLRQEASAARRVYSARSRTAEWIIVTAASAPLPLPLKSKDSGRPSVGPRPRTTTFRPSVGMP